MKKTEAHPLYKRFFRAIALWGLLPVAVLPVTAQQYVITHITEKVRLDGELTEHFWQHIPALENFVQNFPSDTAPARERTEVKLAFDDRNLYVAAICHDSLPGAYVVQTLKRDFSVTRSDAFVISLSPQGDKTNGYSFGSSPYGVQREGLLANAGAMGVTTAWDNKWFCETRRTGNAWVTEFQIPLKTLRYKSGSQQWDFNFARFNFKTNETTTWQRVPLGFNTSHLGFSAPLLFGQPLRRAGANLAFIPYVRGGASWNYAVPGDTKIKNLVNGGADVKVGVTSSLNLDLTVNPDFSTVEVDDQVVNLDRFEIFLPERRQFFIENADLFDQFGFTRIRPFFSRRIGLVAAAGINKEIPIISGVRLSGNIDRNWRIGIMNIQTLKDEEVQSAAQNFTVAAVRRRVFNRSNFGIIAVNKYSFDRNRPALQNHNTVAGIDYNLHSKNNLWMGKVFYHHSFYGSAKADGGANAIWLHYRTPTWMVDWNHEYVGKDYRAEVGFVPRTAYFRLEPSAGRTFYPKSKTIFSHNINLYNSTYWNTYNRTDSVYFFELSDMVARAAYTLTLKSSASLNIQYNEVITRLSAPFDPVNPVQRPHPLPAGRYQYRFAETSFASDFRKRFTWRLRLNGGSFFNGHKITYAAEAGYRFQPYGQWSVWIERNEILLPAPFRNGHLTLVGSRLEVTFSKEVFFTGIVQYNTQQRVFITNLRLQWRFRPMSDVFIVYTDNYDSALIKKQRAFIIKFNYWFSL